MMFKKWSVAVLVVLCVSITGVAHGDMIYHLQADSDYTDATGNYSAGVAGGNATITTTDAAVGDGALALDGDGDLLMVPGGIALGTGDFTWAMWIKVDRKEEAGQLWEVPGYPGVMSGTLYRHQLIYNGQGIPNTQLFIESTPENVGKIGFFASRNNTNLQFTDTYSNATVDDGEWHHIAAVMTRTSTDMTLTCYIDGEKDSETTQTTALASLSLTPVSENLYIGHHTAWDTRATDGLIDDIRVYNTALDGDAIASLAATAVPEPSVFALLLGMICTGWAIRKK